MAAVTSVREPVGAISDPPTDREDGNSSRNGPDEGEDEIRYKAHGHKEYPEDFPAHERSVAEKRSFDTGNAEKERTAWWPAQEAGTTKTGRNEVQRVGRG